MNGSYGIAFPLKHNRRQQRQSDKSGNVKSSWKTQLLEGAKTTYSSDMSMITGNIRDIISIKLKSRHDSFTDQFSRIFMVKIFIISSLIMSVDFFSDKVACIVPKNSHLTPHFVHSACWIQGFYIYEEMIYRVRESGYYGIPKDLEVEGIDRITGKLCRKYDKATGDKNDDCEDMTKRFYLQYQYFPFYIASLAILYYLPYALFRMVNTDIISLRGTVKKQDSDGLKIAKHYFNYKMNGGVRKLRIKSMLNFLIKLIYVAASVAGFLLTDLVLHGEYLSYGFKWVQWSRLSNSLAYDYMGKRTSPRPGNTLLPAIGFCEIAEGTRDVRTVFINNNKFICEISPNILYQYVLSVMWFMFTASITVSVIGAVLMAGQYIMTVIAIRFGKDTLERKVYASITYREIQYLQFIRTRNLPLFGEVLGALETERHLTALTDNHHHPLMNGDARETVHV